MERRDRRRSKRPLVKVVIINTIANGVNRLTAHIRYAKGMQIVRDLDRTGLPPIPRCAEAETTLDGILFDGKLYTYVSDVYEPVEEPRIVHSRY